MKKKENLNKKQRAMLVICGALGLVFWVGFLLGPIRGIATAFIPFKTNHKK